MQLFYSSLQKYVFIFPKYSKRCIYFHSAPKCAQTRFFFLCTCSYEKCRLERRILFIDQKTFTTSSDLKIFLDFSVKLLKSAKIWRCLYSNMQKYTFSNLVDTYANKNSLNKISVSIFLPALLIWCFFFHFWSAISLFKKKNYRD